jgi:hypothetical protein
MTKRAAIAAVFVLIAFWALRASTSRAQGGYPYPQPSYALLNALTAVQGLSVGDATQLQSWARSGNLRPPSPIFTSLDQVEAQIAAMSAPEQNAIVAWINGGGRGALYARNVTDSQIGPCKFPIDPPSCSSGSAPNKQTSDWRSIPFALGPGANAASGIAIDGGFAVVKNDGTAETHCLTFRNTSPKTATAITFGYQLYGASDNLLNAGSTQRTGTFSTGVAIAGPASFSDYTSVKSGVGNKDTLQNCWSQTSGLANIAFLQATYMTIQVTSVNYSDGTTWPSH